MPVRFVWDIEPNKFASLQNKLAIYCALFLTVTAFIQLSVKSAMCSVPCPDKFANDCIAIIPQNIITKITKGAVKLNLRTI